jgi:hypothetical protein
MQARPQTMTLELDPGSEPISGRIIDDRGARSFSGWLELAAALQAACDPVAGVTK